MRYRELIENTDDDDLFGGSDRRSPTPEKAVAKFKMFFPINKRVSWSKMHFGTIDRLFGFSTDSRFHAGASHDRYSYWGTQAYTNRETGLGLLIYEDSGQGTWAYLGAQSREDMARMIQQLVAADQLEDPEAAKQRRLAKQQGRAAAAEKKGIRVGAKIRVPYQRQTATAEVVSITKGGKLNLRMIDGPDAGQLHSWQPSAHSVRKADVLGENDDDDDMFATPTIKFADVFNEYDEDELVNRGFEYGDDPDSDIDILNDYLEGYKNFRVVGLSGGEHDLVLHLDRSSKLRETDDDELFGDPEQTWEFQGHEREMDANADYIKDQARDLRLKFLGRHEYENWVVAYEFKGREQNLEHLNSVLRNKIGDGYGGAEPVDVNESNDDELFGSPSFNAEQAGRLIASTGATSGELVDPESIQNALEHAANRVLNSPVIQNKAREQLEKWMAIDDDTQWELVDQIANVVYEINGDGWEPEDTIYNESDDELFGKKWQERINMSSIELDGIDYRDSPDFSDAHVSYAEFDDETPLNNEQLEWLTNELSSTGELHELVWDSLHEGKHAL